MQFNQQDICNKIEEAYQKLGFQLGWSFLYTPFDTLHDNTYPIAFLGLNPGADCFIESSMSCEEGSAYRVEKWGSHAIGDAPLQNQIQSLFSRLINRVGWPIGTDELMDRTLSANLVPFRSGTWNALKNKEQALQFSEGLWSSILAATPKAVYFTISKVTFNSLRNILEQQGYTQAGVHTKAPVGWSNVTYEVLRLEKDGQPTTIIRMPHLSSYKIFSRENCNDAIEDMISSAVENLHNWQRNSRLDT